MIYDMNMNN